MRKRGVLKGFVWNSKPRKKEKIIKPRFDRASYAKEYQYIIHCIIHNVKVYFNKPGSNRRPFQASHAVENWKYQGLHISYHKTIFLSFPTPLISNRLYSNYFIHMFPIPFYILSLTLLEYTFWGTMNSWREVRPVRTGWTSFLTSLFDLGGKTGLCGIWSLISLKPVFEEASNLEIGLPQAKHCACNL